MLRRKSDEKAAGPVTLTQYLRVLKHQWLVVALLAALGLGGAAAYTFQQTPVYSAQTQLFVSARTDTGISQLTQGGTFTQQRVKSYANVVTSPLITNAVVTRLRLPYSAEELKSRISASSPPDTVLLDITVTDTDPARAAAIANAVGDEFPRMVAMLERQADQDVSPVTASVTRRATVPAVPVSPRVSLNLALGLIVGLGLGIGAAVLRDQFNTSVNGVGDIERLTGAIPLGVVPYDAAATKQPLVTTDQFGGRAEAFRTLRTNLQFADVDDPPQVITITSALPAEGKTTTACNIALTLAQSGARVVLVEGDLRKPAVGRYLGISNAAGLTNVLAGQHELRDVLVGYQRDTLAVLPSGPTPPNPSEMLGSQQMRQLLQNLAADYDIVIIDAPPLLPVTDAAVLAVASDGAILVIRHGKSRREEVERAIQALSSVNAKVLGTVLNFAPVRRRRSGYDGYGYGYGYGATEAKQPSRRERKRAAAAMAKSAALNSAPLNSAPLNSAPRSAVSSGPPDSEQREEVHMASHPERAPGLFGPPSRPVSASEVTAERQPLRLPDTRAVLDLTDQTLADNAQADNARADNARADNPRADNPRADKVLAGRTVADRLLAGPAMVDSRPSEAPPIDDPWAFTAPQPARPPQVTPTAATNGAPGPAGPPENPAGSPAPGVISAVPGVTGAARTPGALNGGSAAHDPPLGTGVPRHHRSKRSL